MSHVEQMLGELGGREAPTGASNRFRQFTVQTNRVAGNGQFALESLDQADQMRHLAFSERSTLTVADQADTDGVLIVIWASLAHDMGTGQLMIPTVSRMDFTIGKAISIAEDEVVSQSLVAEAQMLAMDRFRCPERLAKMVDHDARPTVSIQLHGQIKDGITAVCDLIEFRQIGQREASGRHRTPVEAE